MQDVTIQSVSPLFTAYRIFLSRCVLCNTSSFLTQSVQIFFAILLQHRVSKTSQVFTIYCPKCPSLSTIKSYVPAVELHQLCYAYQIILKFLYSIRASYDLFSAPFLLVCNWLVETVTPDENYFMKQSVDCMDKNFLCFYAMKRQPFHSISL